jgi:hypothetical protein
MGYMRSSTQGTDSMSVSNTPAGSDRYDLVADTATSDASGRPVSTAVRRSNREMPDVVGDGNFSPFSPFSRPLSRYADGDRQRVEAAGPVMASSPQSTTASGSRSRMPMMPYNEAQLAPFEPSLSFAKVSS